MTSPSFAQRNVLAESGAVPTAKAAISPAASNRLRMAEISLSDVLGAEARAAVDDSPIARVGRGGFGVSATAAISAECRGAGNEQFEGNAERAACGCRRRKVPMPVFAGIGASSR
jgi:hypothetical protein